MNLDMIPLKAAAERFGVSYDRLRRAAYDARLHAQRRGHEWIVAPNEVERFLREGGKRSNTVAKAASVAPRVAPRVIAVALVKGGVGKTTTTLNLGAALAEQGQRVLLIDCDPQCSLSLALGIEVRGITHTLASAITDYLTTYTLGLDQAIMSTPTGVDLVPASIRLNRVDKELNLAAQREFVLKKLVDPVLPHYDVVLLDTMPATNNLVTNALVAATELIIPLEPEYLGVESLAMTLEDVEQIRRSGLNPRLTVRGIVLTQVDGRTVLHREIVDYTKDEFGTQVPVFNTIIRKSVRFPESQARHQSILRYEPSGEGAAAYRALATEVLHGGR